MESLEIILEKWHAVFVDEKREMAERRIPITRVAEGLSPADILPGS